MSAIDFTMEIERVADPHGDRVKVTYNGKFLPYPKWCEPLQLHRRRPPLSHR